MSFWILLFPTRPLPSSQSAAKSYWCFFYKAPGSFCQACRPWLSLHDPFPRELKGLSSPVSLVKSIESVFDTSFLPPSCPNCQQVLPISLLRNLSRLSTHLHPPTDTRPVHPPSNHCSRLSCSVLSVLSQKQDGGPFFVVKIVSSIYKPNFFEQKCRGVSWNAEGLCA